MHTDSVIKEPVAKRHVRCTEIRRHSTFGWEVNQKRNVLSCHLKVSGDCRQSCCGCNERMRRAAVRDGKSGTVCVAEPPSQNGKHN